MNVHPSEAFRQLYESEMNRRMSEARAALDKQGLDAVAKLKGGVTYPTFNTPPAEAIAALVPQWPKDWRPLPLWFTDPARAAELDPPGKPCAAACSETDEERADRVAEAERIAALNAPEFGPRDMSQTDFDGLVAGRARA